jgi:hypothetical protein
LKKMLQGSLRGLANKLIPQPETGQQANQQADQQTDQQAGQPAQAAS